MAPIRKSRSVNEVSSSKDEENLKKSMQRKRKLSDMLGSQWSKEELEHFYKAYRKYGKDWKKVAAAVRNRSVDMVEALYMMNRAYLSLPEGIASSVGLIAMMTDHYYNLVGSDSDPESSDGSETSRKSQKHDQGSVRDKTSKGSRKKLMSNLETEASKKKPSGGTQPRTVGKRTRRLPVSFSYKNVDGRKFVSLTRHGLILNTDIGDDSVKQEVALALAGASTKRGCSPPVSQLSNRRTGNVTSLPSWRGGRMGTELESTSAKHLNDMDEDGLEEIFGSRVCDKGELARGRSFLMGSEDAGTAVGSGKRIHLKKSDTDYIVNNHLDGIKEVSGGIREQNFGVKPGKIARHIARKNRKKDRDEGSAFDALQILADLSLMIPATATGIESTVDVKEKEDNIDGKNGLPETDNATHPLDMLKCSGVNTKGNHAEDGASVAKLSNHGKGSGLDNNGIPEVKENSSSGLSRKKLKMLISKIPRTEFYTATHLSDSQDAEARDAGKVKSKGEHAPFSTSQQKQGKWITYLRHSSASADLRGGRDESALTTAQVPVPNLADLPGNVRRRPIKDLEKPQTLNELNKNDVLTNCLSNEQLRQWCFFEWFYSAIDYPWFARSDFVEYLKHVGLGHVSRLNRVEWGVIRSSIGRPRRFSEHFLKEEKKNLSQYRESVRKYYTELREGARKGLPTDLARPLSVDQRVMAIHPKTREVHDGNVLTVDYNRCRVQFDRRELGVEFVQDIDCMPLNSLENMPVSLARKAATMNELSTSFNELKMSRRAKNQKPGGAKKLSSGEIFELVDLSSHLSPTCRLNNLMEAKGIPNYSNFQANVGINEPGNGQKAVYSALLGQMQAKEADVQALAELTRALKNKLRDHVKTLKETVLSELQRINDVFENQRNGDNELEYRKKQHVSVLVQLDAVNDQISSALRDLRQSNTYPSSLHRSPSTQQLEETRVGHRTHLIKRQITCRN